MAHQKQWGKRKLFWNDAAPRLRQLATQVRNNQRIILQQGILLGQAIISAFSGAWLHQVQAKMRGQNTFFNSFLQSKPVRATLQCRGFCLFPRPWPHHQARVTHKNDLLDTLTQQQTTGITNYMRIN